MTSTDHRDRALAKLRLELKKDIALATRLASDCGLLELLFLVYTLHFSRLVVHLPEKKRELTPADVIGFNTIEESLRYAISLIAKHGTWTVKKQTGGSFALDNELVNALLRVATHINAKYESSSLIAFFDVEVSGPRDKDCRIDMAPAMEDPTRKRLLDYFVRIDHDNNKKKERILDIEDLLDDFKTEYAGAEHLFESDAGIPLEDFCRQVECLMQLVTDRIKLVEPRLEKLPDGNIDVSTQSTFLRIASCLIFKKSELLEILDRRFVAYIEKNSFDGKKFDECELRYHYVTRNPFLLRSNVLIISPELVLDSLFANTHYSLIESKETKSKYLAAQAEKFLDRILGIATPYGYVEVDRERHLYEGKNTIGDIDLVLRDSRGAYLLVEAKNHALPLGVYFKDPDDTISHLNYLQNEWEKKVKRRIEHLRSRHSKYGIPDGFKYIVVSRFPEVAAHFSEVLMLSLAEFASWLEGGANHDSFSAFYSTHYSKVGTQFSMEDLERLRADGLFLGQLPNE